jgi:hypothetical protein
VPHEVEAFLRREERQRDGEQLDDLVEGARSRGAEEGFQLRKRELDRIEVWTVGWEKAEPGTDAFNGGLHLGLLVDHQVVEDDDVAGAQRGHQHLLDVGEERRIVEGAIEDGGRLQSIDTKRRNDGVRLPMPARRVIVQPLTAGTAAIATQQIGRDARLVEEEIAPRIVQRQRVLPAPARRGDISAPLFVGVYRFF